MSRWLLFAGLLFLDYVLYSLSIVLSLVLSLSLTHTHAFSLPLPRRSAVVASVVGLPCRHAK